MSEKQKVQIFIASSRHAAIYAQKLSDTLSAYPSENYKLVPKTWWSTNSTLAAILDDLFEQTQQNDFAIILLTSELTEDVPEGDEDSEKRRIRYNAIYEAGLFSGALGPSKDRCFLVASGAKAELPTDLLGLKFYFFNEKDSAQRDNRLREIANQIGAIITKFPEDYIRPLRGLKLPLLTKSDLLRRESHKDNQGGRLKQCGALVFVNTPNPIEMEDKEFAQKVIQNMLNYRIKYEYVFENTGTNITALAKVIANLATAELPEEWKENRTKAFATIAANLNIYLVKANPGLEYCVHNADTDDAVCYLRTSDDGREPRWIEWEKGHNARLVATEIDRIREQGVAQAESHVFQNTHDVRIFDIEEKNAQKGFVLNELGRKIWGTVDSWLPNAMKEDEKADIKKVCFGSAQ